MHLFERKVNVSLNPARNAHRNGLIWFIVNGVVKTIPFMVDRPNLIKNGMNPSTYNRVMSQIRNMGIEPDAVELFCKDVKYVYDGRGYKNKTGIPMSAAQQRQLTA